MGYNLRFWFKFNCLYLCSFEDCVVGWVLFIIVIFKFFELFFLLVKDLSGVVGKDGVIKEGILFRGLKDC